MDLDDLRGFLTIAKTQSITHAAHALGISQPTLSRRIQRLETRLGIPLFERTARAVRLTEAGTLFLDKARRITAMMDDAIAECTDRPGVGLVRVGAIPTVAPYLLPSIISTFASKWPDARLRVTEDTTDRLLSACRDGQLDVVILAEPFDATHLDKRLLLEEELLLVAPPEHHLAGMPRVPIAKIDQEPMVLLNEGHCLSDAIDAFCRRRAVQVVTVERVHQLATLQELVALGHGISIMPALAAQQDTSPRRVYRPFTKPVPRRRIVAVRNIYRFQPHIVSAFWDMLKPSRPAPSTARR